MDLTLLCFAAWAFLCAFNAGAMTTLQIQHYGIYPRVGREGFGAYIQANNKAAFVPVILPALLLLFTAVVLLVQRPRFMHVSEAIAAVSLNFIQLGSTLLWQRRLQGEMARTGYDEAKTRLLLSTNWIRTVAFLVQAALAMIIVLRAITASPSTLGGTSTPLSDGLSGRISYVVNDGPHPFVRLTANS
jgi:hypothetical protein